MLDRGRTPTHLDSHKHVHMAPALFDLACELARQFGVRCVRLASERVWRAPWAPPCPPLCRARRFRQWVAGQALRLTFGRRNRRRRRQAGLTGNDHFFGLADTGGWGELAARAMLQRLPAGVSELMVHPGLEEPARADRLTTSRPLELASLFAADVPRLAARLSIRMIHYGRLRPGTP